MADELPAIFGFGRWSQFALSGEDAKTHRVFGPAWSTVGKCIYRLNDLVIHTEGPA